MAVLKKLRKRMEVKGVIIREMSNLYVQWFLIYFNVNYQIQEGTRSINYLLITLMLT
jgi:hypothetical protein